MVARFAFLVAAGLLLESGISGRPLGDVVRGTVGRVTGNRGVGFVSPPDDAVTQPASQFVSSLASAVGSATGKIYEIFYDPLGYYYDSGKIVQGAIGGHGGHVHFAAPRAIALRWAKIAQNQFNLTIREMAPYDPVDPVHTEGSFHHKGQAFDASGSPSDMLAFARYAVNAATGKRKPKQSSTKGWV